MVYTTALSSEKGDSDESRNQHSQSSQTRVMQFYNNASVFHLFFFFLKKKREKKTASDLKLMKKRM